MPRGRASGIIALGAGGENTIQQFFLSFSELRYNDFEFNSWQIRQHLRNWTRCYRVMKFETARLHFISKVFASRRGFSSKCKCRAWTQATLESINDTLLVFQSMALCHAHWVISQFCRLRKMGWIVVFSFRLVSGSYFLTAYIRWDVILVAPKQKSRLLPWPVVKATIMIVEVPKNISLNSSFNQRFATIKMDHG